MSHDKIFKIADRFIDNTIAKQKYVIDLGMDEKIITVNDQYAKIIDNAFKIDSKLTMDEIDEVFPLYKDKVDLQSIAKELDEYILFNTYADNTCLISPNGKKLLIRSESSLLAGDFTEILEENIDLDKYEGLEVELNKIDDNFIYISIW